MTMPDNQVPVPVGHRNLLGLSKNWSPYTDVNFTEILLGANNMFCLQLLRWLNLFMVGNSYRVLEWIKFISLQIINTMLG